MKATLGSLFVVLCLSIIARAGDLHTAASLGDVAAVQELLEKGTAVDSRDAKGAFPLHAACSAGNLAIVEMLLVCGADPVAKDRAGKTALSVALKGQRQDIVTVLLAWQASKGGTVDMRKKYEPLLAKRRTQNQSPKTIAPDERYSSVPDQDEQESVPSENWSGFRGLKWNADIRGVPGMVPLNRTITDSAPVNPEYRSCHRESDKLAIGQVILESITYGFYKGRFYQVRISARDPRQRGVLRDALNAWYGPPSVSTASVEKHLFPELPTWKDDVDEWKGSYLVPDDVEISLSFSTEISGHGLGSILSLTFTYQPILGELLADNMRIRKEKEAAEEKTRLERTRDAARDF